jgi:hypothetical protein
MPVFSVSYVEEITIDASGDPLAMLAGANLTGHDEVGRRSRGRRGHRAARRPRPAARPSPDQAGEARRRLRGSVVVRDRGGTRGRSGAAPRVHTCPATGWWSTSRTPARRRGTAGTPTSAASRRSPAGSIPQLTAAERRLTKPAVVGAAPPGVVQRPERTRARVAVRRQPRHRVHRRERQETGQPDGPVDSIPEQLEP